MIELACRPAQPPTADRATGCTGTRLGAIDHAVIDLIPLHETKRQAKGHSLHVVRRCLRLRALFNPAKLKKDNH